MSTQGNQVSKDTPSRPIPLTVNESNIPCVLKEKEQWVNWVYQLDEDKRQYKKIPKNSLTGGNAQSNNSETWSTFVNASDGYHYQNLYDGIGFCFSATDGLTGIDIDHVINSETGDIDQRAQEIFDRFKETYCEVSPSGTGIRIFCYGKPVMPGRKNEGKIKWLEAYTYPSSRYLTVTGHKLSGAHSVVTEQQESLDWLYDKYFKPAQAKPELKPVNPVPLSLDDNSLLDKARNARNGDHFQALFDRGDTSAYGGDESSADLALCSLLAFWTQKDAGRIDRLFRQSGLMRKKWDRADYRQRTIDKAIAECREVYADGGKGMTDNNVVNLKRNDTTRHEPKGATNDDLLADYVSVASLDGQQFSRTWLVEKFIEKGRVYEFFGKYKEGKTLAVIDMVANLSIGRSWAGRGTKQALIIWVAGEAVEDVKMRIAAWRLRHGITEPMPFYIRVKPVYMTDKEFAERLAKEITAFTEMHPGLPVLLVLDTVARCMAPGADENSIMGLGAFINNLLDIVVRPTESTAICVHHSGHGDSDRGRGHSSFEGAVDGIIKVCMDKSNGPPVITVAAGRIRSTAGDDAFSFRIETQELPGEDNFGNPIDAPVLRYMADYTPQQKPAGKNERKAVEILESLLATTADSTRGVLVTDWRTAFKKRHLEENPQNNHDHVEANKAANTAWRRVEKALQVKNITRYEGINTIYVTLTAYTSEEYDNR